MPYALPLEFCQNGARMKNIEFSAERILSLTNCPAVRVFDSIDSTNTAAKAMAANNSAHGEVVIARLQTKGRGRLGRSFCSPEGGLYMSIILRPTIRGEDALKLTAVAAVAVAEAIEKHTSHKALIKWVNDVYIGGKKVCGILTEASLKQDGGIEYAVLGLGVNLYTPRGGFAEEIADIATALDKDNLDENELAADIINLFMEYYHDLDNVDILNKYRARQMLVGKKVSVIRFDGEKRDAVAVGVDDDCHMVVEYDDGRQEAVFSGEVSLRIKG